MEQLAPSAFDLLELRDHRISGNNEYKRTRHGFREVVSSYGKSAPQIGTILEGVPCLSFFSLQNHLMRFHAFIRIQFFDTFVCASFLSQITRSHHQFPGLHSRNALLSHHSGCNHDVRNSEGSHVFCLHAVSPRSFYEMVLLSRRTCSMTICRRAMPTTTSIWSSTPIPSPKRWRTRNR